MREKESTFTKKKEQIDLYERLSQHQDYERRLQSMVSEKELHLSQLTDHRLQHQCQKELAVLAGRLYRCRQALLRIEKAIEHQENQYFD